MSFPTYEHFKDSGFQWLGKVPDSWEVNVSRRYFYEIREPGKFDDVQLSATQKFGVVPQTMFMELEDQKVVLALKGLSNFKHVEPDDFVISLRSFQGGIERSKYQGCVSPAYTVLRPKRIIDPIFISYLFKSAGYIVALQSVTDGIREGKNIKYDQFAELGLALPPITEQKSIALFLDHEIAKIDTLVVQQVKLIELLKEKRKSIISHTVTKGLDPTVKMKDSGVEWLGEIPDHWSMTKVSRGFLNIGSGTTPPSDETQWYEGGTIPWITTGELRESLITDTQKFVTQKAIEKFTSLALHPAGSLAIAMYGATIGRLAILGIDAVTNQACCVLSGPTKIQINYAFYWFQAFKQNIIEIYASGGG